MPAGGLTKQAAVLFDENSDALTDSSTARLKDLAFSLMTALANGAGQVELIAYGGAPGDKSSDARRISLKRALAVREALIVRRRAGQPHRRARAGRGRATAAPPTASTSSSRADADRVAQC